MRSLAWLVIALVLAGCAREAEAVPRPTPEAIAANRAVLAEIPLLDGDLLLEDVTVGPVGGVGAMSSVIHERRSDLSLDELGDRFQEALPDWTVICRVDRRFRTGLDLRREDAWVAIGIGRAQIGGVSQATVSVTVNALDGETMERDVVARQVCD